MEFVASKYELRVLAAAKTGGWANFAPEGRSEIRPGFVRALLLGLPIKDDAGGVHEVKSLPAGLRVSGAVIASADGNDLDLSDCVNLPPLALEACRFAGNILFENARLGRLSLKDSQINEVHLRGARLDGALDFSGVTAAVDGAPAWIDAAGCTINGSVAGRGARLRAPKPREKDSIPPGKAIYALRLSGAEIDGTLDLVENFVAEGGVTISAAHIRGDVIAVGAEMTSGEQNALSAQAVNIDGVVMLDRLRATGGVWLLGARIGGTLTLEKSVLKSTIGEGGGFALEAGTTEIGGSVHLSNEFSAAGLVSLIGAKIGGILDCENGHFSNRTADGKGYALIAQAAEINGPVHFRNNFSAEGLVSLSSAKIGGDFDCENGHFSNRTAEGTGDALIAETAEINGSVFFRNKFSAEGQVSLLTTKIGGDLDCHNATFRNEGKFGWSTALDVTRANITRSTHLFGSSFVGAVSLFGTQIGGDLDCRSAKFVCRIPRYGAPQSWENALSATNSTVGGDVNLARTRVIGRLVFEHADIGGGIRWHGLAFPNSIEILDVALSDGKISEERFQWSYSGLVPKKDEKSKLRLPHPPNNEDGKPAARLVLAHAKIGAALQAHKLNASVPLLLDLSAAHAYTLDDENFPAGWGNQEPSDKNQTDENSSGADESELPVTRLDLDGFVYQRIEHFPVEPGGALSAWARLIRALGAMLAKAAMKLEQAVLKLLGHTRFGRKCAKSLESWRREASGVDHATPRLKWLRRQIGAEESKFYPQPYRHLASVLRAQGHLGTARKIAIAEGHETPSGFWGPAKRLFWGWGFGFGLAPVNASFMLVGVLLAGYCLVNLAWREPWLNANLQWQNANPVLVLTPERIEAKVYEPPDGKGQPLLPVQMQCGRTEIEPFFYALDMMLPVVPLHEEDRCEVAQRPHMMLWRVLWAAYSILGKIVASLALLTYSGVMKPKDE